MEEESSAVEYAFGNTESKGFFGKFLTDLCGRFGLGALCGILDIGSGAERASGFIVDHLSVDRRIAAEDGEARLGRGTGDPGADALVPLDALGDFFEHT